MVTIKAGKAKPVRYIDPTVDCVFKRILGSEEHKYLTLHFLNSILGLRGADRIVSLEIIDPYNEAAFIGAKAGVVDVKVRDGGGNVYQIEMQTTVRPHMEKRFIYSWANNAVGCLERGTYYSHKKDTIAIWLLAENLYDTPVLDFFLGFYSPKIKQWLSKRDGIHVVQLKNFSENVRLNRAKAAWIRFFREG